METFPLTFAVFFQSIVSPNMTINKNMSKDALFAGAFYVDKSNPDYISSGTFSDYIKGKRPIRTITVNRICKMSLVELAPRIDLLGFQDTPYILKTIEKLLEIANITPQLKYELLSEMKNTKEMELYITKIFQLSMKCSNKKRELSVDEIEMLNGLGENDSYFNTKSVSHESKERINNKDNENIIFDWRYYLKNNEMPSKKTCDEIDKIFSKQQKESNPIFHGVKILWQDVILPEDFEVLLKFASPMMLNDSATITLDFLDFLYITSLDLKSKKCKKGYLKLLDFSYINKTNNFDDFHEFKNVISNIALSKYSNCCMLVQGDVTILTVDNIRKIIYDKISEEGNVIFAFSENNEIPNYINIKAIFRIDCFITSKSKPIQKANTIKMPDFLKR